VDRYHGGVQAEPIQETNIIQITATGSDPKEVAQLANLTAEAYIETNLMERNKQARKLREFVEAQLAQTEIKLRTAEEAVHRGTISIAHKTSDRIFITAHAPNARHRREIESHG